MQKILRSSILCVVLFSLIVLPVAADEWTDMIKGKYGGETITCAFVPHPSDDRSLSGYGG